MDKTVSETLCTGTELLLFDEPLIECWLIKHLVAFCILIRIGWLAGAYHASGVGVYHVALGLWMPDICLSNLLFAALLLFPQLIEVGHDMWDRFLVHWNSLLKDVDCTWNDIELTDNFFQCLSELFTTATNSIVTTWCNSSLSCYYLLFYGWINFGFTTSVILLSLLGCWRSLSYRWNTSSLLLCFLRAKIFDKLLVILIQVTFPDHDHGIRTTSGEVITTRWEGSWCRLPFMAIQCVQNMTLPQIPDFESWIITTG